MRIIDRGHGSPLVIVPGIQGRWEWMEPGIDVLARQCRVITFSLADEPSCGARFDDTRGFCCYVDQVRDAMDAAGVDHATICGVSYGGLIAAAFAARHPDRTASLLLVSAIPPSWTPNRRVRFYLRAPRLLSPLFIVMSVRLYREVAAAYEGLVAGLVPALAHAARVLTHMFSPLRMARRVHLLERLHLQGELAHVRVPTLIITGDPGLDAVVPVQATRSYTTLWPHAQLAILARTGHLGFITRPDEFARIAVPFVDDAAEGAPLRRRVG
jgi:3-oxoadipate enol-lactonase/4-carboxymuconolactone decarboxylase